MIQSRQKVGPTIADDIKVGAYWAVFFLVDCDGSVYLAPIPQHRVQCGYAGFGKPLPLSR